jgi:putative membrane protein
MNNLPRGMAPPSTRTVPFQNGVVLVGRHLGALGILWTVLLIILWAGVMTALVLLIIRLLRSSPETRIEQTPPTPTSATNQPAEPAPRSEGLRILDERYARGEIGQDEYVERRKDLTSS